MGMQLYDLAGADLERRFNPYCWRIKLRSCIRVCRSILPWRFTEKSDRVLWARPRAGVDRQRPGRIRFLDHRKLFRGQASRSAVLFRGDGGRAVTRFVNAWADVVLVGGILRLIVTDILTHLNEKDRAYLRETREKRLGATLEAVRNKCGRPWSRFAPYSQHSPTSEAGRRHTPIMSCSVFSNGRAA